MKSHCKITSTRRFPRSICHTIQPRDFCTATALLLRLPGRPLHNNEAMIAPLFIACYLQVHSASAQFAIFDENNKSCRELGQCRSVWDIVESCLATIFACTWVAVHLNISKQGKGWLWKYGRRVLAFGMAVFAPEWIIMEAWDQRASAKKIAAKYKGIC